MAVRPRIKFVPGKTYTYSGSEGVYSVIAGEILEGDGVPTGGNLVFGEGAPSSGTGKTNDVYIDTTNFKLHTRGAGGWDVGAAFKGTNGTNGSNGAAGTNGKSVRFGNGAPSSGLGDNDDVYFDLTDFKLHTKSAGSWGSGTVFKGSNGSNGAAGVNGKGIKWGNGAPVGSPGDDDDLYFDLDNLQVYPKVSGAWSNAGKKGFRGTDGSPGLNGTKVLQGVSAPGASDGDDGDTFIDATNHKIYKKTAGSWAEQGSGFKGSTGTAGADGLRGKITLEGAGVPGTGPNLATSTAALTSALSDAGLVSGDLAVGDLYIDTTNHRFYKKTALGWSARGVTFTGPQGLKGDTGDTGTKGDTGDTGNTGADGAGVSKYSSGLGADTYLSADTTASSATTLGNSSYPTVLALSDVMDDVGGVVTRSSHTFQRRALTNSAGSKFTINTAGRYKVDYFATFNIDPASASASSVEITAFIDYSTDDGANFTTLISQTATVSTSSSTAIQTTMELTKTAFFPAGTSLYFKAKRGVSANSVMMIITANAITKSEIGEDTFVVITKL